MRLIKLHEYDSNREIFINPASICFILEQIIKLKNGIVLEPFINTSKLVFKDGSDIIVNETHLQIYDLIMG